MAQMAPKRAVIESKNNSAGHDKALLSAILDSATEYAIITLSPENVITSWNVGAQNIMGWEADEAIGREGNMIFIEEDRRSGAPAAEIAQALGTGRAEDERWHARKDGSRFWGRGLLLPLRGAPGFLKIMQDQTSRRAVEQSLHESEQRFRTIAEHIPQLVFRSRSMGERTWGSPQWVAFSGLSEANSLGLGWLDAVHPADHELTLEAWAAAETRGELYVEHRIRRAIDGQYRWFQTRATRLMDEQNRTLEWFGTSTDIDDLRRLKERQDVLVKELHHRTGNLLAIVSSIARRTVQSSESLEAFSVKFDHRIQALSRVQRLIARENQAGLGLDELVEMEIGAHGLELDGQKIRIEGSRISLPERHAETLALALHELATNAAKHGALANDTGSLEVRWWVSDNALCLEWRETGVQTASHRHDGRRGYGWELIEVALPHALGAQTRIELRPEGVYCLIELPDSGLGGT
jgi:PAS domain S-box-containing protein